jgi:hypothetical protein
MLHYWSKRLIGALNGSFSAEDQIHARSDNIVITMILISFALCFMTILVASRVVLNKRILFQSLK